MYLKTDYYYMWHRVNKQEVVFFIFFIFNKWYSQFFFFYDDSNWTVIKFHSKDNIAKNNLKFALNLFIRILKEGGS